MYVTNFSPAGLVDGVLAEDGKTFLFEAGEPDL